MREKRKLLALIFAVGVLICGIGAGFGFLEFLSLDYVGERTIGETEMAMLEGEAQINLPEDADGIRIYADYGHQYLNLNSDASIPENTVRYKVKYNKKKVTPEFWQDEDGIGFSFNYKDTDEMKEVMELRDKLLADLKKDQIGSYQSSPWIESIDIYLNPKNRDDVTIW